jgi:hypothetical protein
MFDGAKAVGASIELLLLLRLLIEYLRRPRLVTDATDSRRRARIGMSPSDKPGTIHGLKPDHRGAPATAYADAGPPDGAPPRRAPFADRDGFPRPERRARNARH